MNKLLGEFRFVKIYMGDILIHSKNINEHYIHLKTVLSALYEADGSINFEKSIFNATEIRFPGHIINQHRIKADISNLKNLEIKITKTKKQLQKLLGYLNWFRPFVKNFATLTARFYDNLKKNEKRFFWNDEYKKRLSEISEIIKSNQILNHINLNGNYILEVDVSKIRVGASLYQKNKLIRLYSYMFKGSEINYTISEKELYAIIKAIMHLKQLILESKIIIKTDA
ncbi:Transposon Tf2-6 polyprotein [Dictyocoela muelleri]|nr:Transposon Tf2-6 polyprotein [Dictyocoela muelleri]